ncbi:hypothetical protein B0T26DRAFT_670550 [Lasiosphaeria miniovina]|uniref:Uncharacterized protein n=1 Tax=Lasiosphaeria miniovina TaxID=1954250 RepID=A0AA40EDD2_9PEZI|nr:uncharacterized protein B0T26DRAFT_670550 [Lasiosphaeria miniovina]KAK0734227.1 hypothetical protein B0T26DRAFT_670550 [Lasiosphaeria miniovina]
MPCCQLCHFKSRRDAAFASQTRSQANGPRLIRRAQEPKASKEKGRDETVVVGGPDFEPSDRLRVEALGGEKGYVDCTDKTVRGDANLLEFRVSGFYGYFWKKGRNALGPSDFNSHAAAPFPSRCGRKDTYRTPNICDSTQKIFLPRTLFSANDTCGRCDEQLQLKTCQVWKEWRYPDYANVSLSFINYNLKEIVTYEAEGIRFIP